MKTIIRLSAREEAKALPVLLRHSPGMVLSDRTYVLEQAAVEALDEADVHYREISTDAIDADLEEILIVERDVRTL